MVGWKPLFALDNRICNELSIFLFTFVWDKCRDTIPDFGG